MNTAALASTVYGDSHSAVRTPRQDEYRAFALVTHRLATASAEGRSGFPQLAAAIHDNQRLWTALAADVALGDNALPASLRAQLFYLAEFTGAHSRKVLSGDAEVDALIDVNTAMMKGLRNAPELV